MVEAKVPRALRRQSTALKDQLPSVEHRKTVWDSAQRGCPNETPVKMSSQQGLISVVGNGQSFADYGDQPF
jgi:hypothetical protein